jgi:hypothetical protein
MIMEVCGIPVPAGTPTVGLWVEVPVKRACTCDRPTCDPWDWRPVDCPTAAPEEYVYTAHDLDRVLRSYGHVWALTAARTMSHNRFRLIARGLFSSRIIGTYVWTWNATYGRYEPEAEPWNVWDARCAERVNGRVPYTLSGLNRLARGDQGPYVRDKEDVPHEGALADFYGLGSAA